MQTVGSVYFLTGLTTFSTLKGQEDARFYYLVPLGWLDDGDTVNPGRCPGLKYCALAGRFFDDLITGDNDPFVLKKIRKNENRQTDRISSRVLIIVLFYPT